MVKIMVVDDEVSIRELVKFNLEKSGYVVECADDGSKALERILDNPPELLILDLMLPGMDGLDICRHLRQQEKTRMLPIIMLTARVEEIDRVVGLEIGADDYLTKPFSPRELVARVKSLLRRSQGNSQSMEKQNEPIIRGKLQIYPERYEAVLDDKVLELTPKEFQLLMQLAVNPGKVYTREFLLENIWGYEFAGDTRTVDVHIRHLRQKLESEIDQSDLIETIRGIGYRFKG
ncbi:MAG: DNA-binding response regulator [Firmicutes bacterium HGW-Firmicutes-12]|jgi:DNA-binding response OmpR family regulator|nr:MAG: DNA-binding response regulator [Firmicutes bacterium HGW-Firmicutes-12]